MQASQTSSPTCKQARSSSLGPSRHVKTKALVVFQRIPCCCCANPCAYRPSRNGSMQSTPRYFHLQLKTHQKVNFSCTSRMKGRGLWGIPCRARSTDASHRPWTRGRRQWGTDSASANEKRLAIFRSRAVKDDPGDDLLSHLSALSSAQGA